MNIVDCNGQGTKEWFDARLGMLTASRIAAAVTKRKRDPENELQARIDLRIELAVERITKKTSAHYVSEWMERGTEMEPLARAAYELRTGKSVQLIDFVLHPDREGLAWAGCSPDGVTDDGLIEIKVPSPNTHAQYLLSGCLPEMYIHQMTWQLACCPEFIANTFVSYCPDFPAPLDLFLCTMLRSNENIAAMESEARTFLASVEAVTERLKNVGLGGH